jgi:hypothetical protein
MTPRDFTNWLQGYLDALPSPLTDEQLSKVKAKLGSVVRVEPALSGFWPHVTTNTTTQPNLDFQTF